MHGTVPHIVTTATCEAHARMHLDKLPYQLQHSQLDAYASWPLKCQPMLTVSKRSMKGIQSRQIHADAEAIGILVQDTTAGSLVGY